MPAGIPGRVRGRDQIREFLTGRANGLVKFDEYRGTVICETTDPQVVIVEYEAHGTVVPTGAPLHKTIIACCGSATAWWFPTATFDLTAGRRRSALVPDARRELEVGGTGRQRA